MCVVTRFFLQTDFLLSLWETQADHQQVPAADLQHISEFIPPTSASRRSIGGADQSALCISHKPVQAVHYQRRCKVTL